MSIKPLERLRAEELYVVQGMNAVDISKAVKVTEKTVSNWVITGRWKDKRKTLIAQKLDNKEKSFAGLRAFLHNQYPALITEIDTAILKYLLT